MLHRRIPRGNYKLSSDAILVAELQSALTTRSKWHGALTRDLLIDSCHQYCLCEPEFSVSGDETTLQADSTVKHRNSNNIENGAKLLNEGKCQKNGAINNIQNVESSRDSMGKGPFMYVVKKSSKAEGLTIECASEHSYRNRADAIQSALERAASQVFLS